MNVLTFFKSNKSYRSWKPLLVFLLVMLGLWLEREEKNVDFKTTTGSSESSSVEGQQELVFCSQNLERFGEKESLSSSKGKQKIRALLQRFLAAKCDVIGLQELAGKSLREAEANLKVLRDALNRARSSARGAKKQTAMRYKGITGESRDRYIRNAFLVDTTKFKIAGSLDLSAQKLMSLGHRGRSGFFTRGPLMLSLEAKDSSGAKQTFIVANLHFKSQRNGYKDKTKTNYEFRRVKAAETLRRNLLELRRKESGEPLLVVMGDRNTDLRNAASEVLLGRLELADFEKACRVLEDLSSSCSEQPPSGGEPEFVSLTKYLGRRGSFKYRGRENKIDEMAILTKDLDRFKDKRGRVSVGLEGAFRKGSDHKLVWARMRF